MITTQTHSYFDLSAYLDRISHPKIDKTARVDIQLLTSLMRQQLFTVAFENIEVQRGHIVSMDAETIYKKIVHEQRGGYCYEVNGLFAQALENLGIAYQFVAARPLFYPMLRPKTHMALVVRLGDAQYLCDLGFGSYGIRAPIALSVTDVPIEQDFDQFMLSCEPNIADPYAEYILHARVGGVWVKQYAFNLSPQLWVDFTPANYVNSTHPEAIFVQKLLLIKHSLTGRTILLGNHLKTITATGTTEQEIADADLVACVQSQFNLVL